MDYFIEDSAQEKTILKEVDELTMWDILDYSTLDVDTDYGWEN